MIRFLLACMCVLATNSAFAADAPLTLVKTIPRKGVDGKLDHIAVDPKGERLYVANKPNNTLDIVDLKTGKLVKQIADQGKASGVAYATDLDMVYAGNGAGTCNDFSCSDYKLVFSTKAPGADNVHINSETKLVYVGCGETLAVLDAKTGEPKTSDFGTNCREAGLYPCEKTTSLNPSGAIVEVGRGTLLSPLCHT